MSEYTPITGELRDTMRQWGWVESDGSITFATSPLPPSIDVEQSLAISGSDFDRLCDAIDSIHAQLERENAALKAELDRVLGEQEGANEDSVNEQKPQVSGIIVLFR